MGAKWVLYSKYDEAPSVFFDSKEEALKCKGDLFIYELLEVKQATELKRYVTVGFYKDKFEIEHSFGDMPEVEIQDILDGCAKVYLPYNALVKDDVYITNARLRIKEHINKVTTDLFKKYGFGEYQNG